MENENAFLQKLDKISNLTQNLWNIRRIAAD